MAGKVQNKCGVHQPSAMSSSIPKYNIQYRQLRKARLKWKHIRNLRNNPRRKWSQGPKQRTQLVLRTGFYLMLLSDYSRSILSEGLSCISSLPPSFALVPGCSSLRLDSLPSLTSHQSLHTHSKDDGSITKVAQLCLQI